MGVCLNYCSQMAEIYVGTCTLLKTLMQAAKVNQQLARTCGTGLSDARPDLSSSGVLDRTRLGVSSRAKPETACDRWCERYPLHG